MSNFTSFDHECMLLAIKQAALAAEMGEVPVGAVLTQGHEILATGYNQPIAKNDPSAHAEIIALRNGAEKIKNYRLINTTLYVTLEPCPMCVGALIHARVQRIVYGAADPKAGALGGAIDLQAIHNWNHKIDCLGGLLSEPCGQLLRDFFKQRR